MKKTIYCLGIACAFAGLSVNAMISVQRLSESGFATQAAKLATQSVEEAKNKKSLSLLLNDNSLQELSLGIDVQPDGVWDEIIQSGRDLDIESNQLLARPTSSYDLDTKPIQLLKPPTKRSFSCRKVRFGNITVDRREHQVFVGCEVKKTNEVERCIVEYLCTRGGNAATIEDITSYVLNNVNGASRKTVCRSIYELQRKLVDTDGRKYIYRVVAVHDGLREMIACGIRWRKLDPLKLLEEMM